jgi:hypothetical protein
VIVLLWGCIDRGGDPIQITVAGVACFTAFRSHCLYFIAYAVGGNACKYVAVGVEYVVHGRMFAVKRVGIIGYLRPQVCFFPGLLFGPEDAGDNFLRNIRSGFFRTQRCYNI